MRKILSLLIISFAFQVYAEEKVSTLTVKNDIQEMLIENGAPETDLVPFVLACAEYEQNQLNVNSTSLTRSIDWPRVGECAIKAIGLDIFYGLNQSTLSTWGVPAMKKAFKSIAKKLLGPIGAIIAVGEFVACYYFD